MNGVAYVDDSKATNAPSRGPRWDSVTVQLCGSLEARRRARVDELVKQVEGKLRAVVVIGQDQEPWRGTRRAGARRRATM